MNNVPKIHETDPEVQRSYLLQLFNGNVYIEEEIGTTDRGPVEDMDVEWMAPDAAYDVEVTSSDYVEPDIYDGSYTLLIVGDNDENIQEYDEYILGDLADTSSDIYQESITHKEPKIEIVQKQRNVLESQNNLGANSSKISQENVRAQFAALEAKQNATDRAVSPERDHTSLEKIRAEIAKIKANNKAKPLQESKTHTDKWLETSHDSIIFDTKKLQWKKDFNVTVVQLSKEDQIKQMKARNVKKMYSDAYQCEFCYHVFSGGVAFLKHMEKHDPRQGEYACDVCHLRYPRRSLLNSHVANNHLFDFICNECGFVSKSRSKAGVHAKKHMGIKYDCKICGKLFNLPRSLASHMKNKHGGDLQCSVCGDAFHTEKGLRAHLNLSHKKAVFAVMCPFCGVQFYSDDALRRHRPLYGPCDRTLRACAACGEGFGSEDLLEQHKLDWHTVTYQCDLCCKQFDTRSKYRSHMIRHQQATICEVCGCIMASKYALEVHLRQVHVREKPFQCDHCGHRSSAKQGLEDHIMYTHMGMKRPPSKMGQCRLCLRTFRHKSNLKRHDLFVHKRLRPFCCEICAKTYQDKQMLQTHIDTKHFGLPWPKRGRLKTKYFY